ncbi:hypothetical protein IQ268_29555, partial [Oculatella sp. LEGE 06141]|uniref:hypothetical protein n=1 Tax=Oculatella sp. LEGE 06141 TaxID=1828648 RepID=UPI001A004761
MSDRIDIRRKSPNASNATPAPRVPDSATPIASHSIAHAPASMPSSELATAAHAQPDTQPQEALETALQPEPRSLLGHQFSQIAVSTRQIQPSMAAGEEPPHTSPTSEAVPRSPSVHPAQWPFSGNDFSRIRRTLLQPKLTISQPNDPYEQEADRVADQVMRMPDAAPTLDPT